MPLPLTIGTGRALLAQSGNPALRYTNKVKALGPIAYYPQAEPSGTTIVDESGNGRNGTYVGVTLGQPGIGDGRTAAGYDGVTSYGNIYSASLAGAWNGQELTISTWVRIPTAGVWTDGIARRVGRIRGGTDLLDIYKLPSTSSVQIDYLAGGVARGGPLTIGAITTWFQIAITVSKTADQLRLYLNGAQVGATQTGLGAWTGLLSASPTQNVLGASTTVPNSPWLGIKSHTAIFNRALSAAEIASLAVVP